MEVTICIRHDLSSFPASLVSWPRWQQHDLADTKQCKEQSKLKKKYLEQVVKRFTWKKCCLKVFWKWEQRTVKVKNSLFHGQTESAFLYRTTGILECLHAKYIAIKTSYKDYDVFDRYWFNFQFIQNLNIREGNVEITETDDKKVLFWGLKYSTADCNLYDFLQP